MKRLLTASMLLLLLRAACLHAAPVSLFDGKTLTGWEGETEKTWRVRDGTIVGGSLEGNPRNEFLATTKSYRNFRLRLDYKLVGTEGFINGGVQLRSRRIASPPNEMSGYQADIGAGHSGSLYDESRRKRTLAEPAKELIERVEKPGQWNTYEIRAEGPRIRLFVNGALTVDYAERESGIDESGVIALQIHGNCKAEIAFRNITIDEEIDATLPGRADVFRRFGEPDALVSRPTPFDRARFGLQDGDVIVFAGEGNLAREQSFADLEARLALAFAERQPRFRSMAMDGDTVYIQWRDLNFGTWRDQLATAGATTVIAQFGQMESLDGPGRIGEFVAAYARLLDEFTARTPRIVLLSPMPFERPLASHAPDLTRRNVDTRAYVDAVRSLARQRGFVFVDLFTPLVSRSAGMPRLTDDGIHLNADGSRVVAGLIAQALGGTAENSPPPEQLRAAIIEKNQLFAHAWRPPNWPFAYGDRIVEKFSQPAGDQPTLRIAFERTKPLLVAADARIHALARGKPGAAPINALLSLSPPPASTPALTPEEELATFTIADGYEVNLFASERDGVVKPTHLSWDEQGRLLVTCSPSYPLGSSTAPRADYVLALEDRDGNGRADRATRIVEGLTLALGASAGDGGVYVCDYDRVVHVRDTDGDGRADVRAVVLAGFGVGDTHQLINSITRGPDGCLWLAQGLHVFSRVETPWGITQLEKAGVWRWNPRTLRLDAFFNGGMAGYNCFGVAFDDYGQVFHKSADRPEGYYSVPGLVRTDTPDNYHSVGALFVTTPKTTSLDIIGTRALPDNVQGCAVIGGYFGGVVELHRFIDDGAGFRTEQLPKLLKSSSGSFRPVGISVGPDGAIYVADWFNPIIGHYQASYADPQRDKTHGRIWRITAKNLAATARPRLAGLAPAALLEHLHSPERWTRAQAKRLLFEAPIADVVRAADDWIPRLDPNKPGYEHLLLELCGVYEAHETPRPDLLAKLLAARDPRVRAYGARVAGAWADRLDNSLAALRQSIRDPNPRVRLETIVALSYVARPESMEVALQAREAPRDRFIDYALRQTGRALQPQWQPELAAGRLTFGGNAAHAAFLRELAGPPKPAPRGQDVYESLCLNCHQPDGRGLPAIYPPLAGSEWIRGDADTLIKIVLHGLGGPLTVAGQIFGLQTPIPMPPSGLSDERIADVLTYVRTRFGNGASSVTATEVNVIREQTRARTSHWTAEELRR